MSKSLDAGEKEQGATANRVTALARGLAILACFDRPRLELTVSEIARRVGLSQATAWRLCATLIDRGFLVRGSAGATLRVGARALTLGYAAINGMDLPSIVLPHMRAMSNATGSNVTLSLRQGVEMLSVEQIDGEFVLPSQPIGWRAALSSSPSGLAVLAALPTDELEIALRQLRSLDSDAWPRRSKRIEEAQAQYRQEGYVMMSLFVGQYTSLAIPLVESTSGERRYWAVGCGSLQPALDEQRIALIVKELLQLGRVLQPAAAATRIA